MDKYVTLYNEVKFNLEKFLKEYFNVGSFSDPQNVAFYDGEKTYNVIGKISEGEAEELLEDDFGIYTFDGTIIVRVKDNLEETLAHELLHHVGTEIEELKVLSDDEYLTQLLTNAYMKWRHPEYNTDDESDDDVIRIHLDDYGIANSRARGKSAEEIVSIFKSEILSENTCEDCIPITIS